MKRARECPNSWRAGSKKMGAVVDGELRMTIPRSSRGVPRVLRRTAPCWPRPRLSFGQRARRRNTVAGADSVLVALWRASGLAEARVAGPHDGLGAVGDLELGEDVRHAVADGLRAQDQLAGNGVVVVALSDEFENLALSVGELGEGQRRAGCLWSGEVLDDAQGGSGPVAEPQRETAPVRNQS